MTVNMKFKIDIHDLWVGVFWRYYRGAYLQVCDIYICIVPALPFEVRFQRDLRGGK